MISLQKLKNGGYLVSKLNENLNSLHVEPRDDGDRLMRLAQRILWSTIAIASVVAIFFIVLKGKLPPYQMDHLGQTGDFFGGLLNPVIGLATIVLVFITLRLQKAELDAAKLELQQSRAVLIEQNDALAKQSFEQTFFSWLASYRQIAEAVRFTNKEGLQAFTSFYEEKIMSVLTSRYFATLLEPGTLDEGDKNYMQRLHDHCDLVRAQFNSYFISALPPLNTLKSQIKWIVGQPFSNSQKLLYVEMLHTQLSDHEKIALLYFCASIDPDLRFFRIARSYGVFESIINDRYMDAQAVHVATHWKAQKQAALDDALTQAAKQLEEK